MPPRHSLVPARGRPGGDGGGGGRHPRLPVRERSRTRSPRAVSLRAALLLLARFGCCSAGCAPVCAARAGAAPAWSARRGAGSGAPPPSLKQRGLPCLLPWQRQRACSEFEENNCYLIPRNSFPAFSLKLFLVRIELMGRRGRKMRR